MRACKVAAAAALHATLTLLRVSTNTRALAESEWLTREAHKARVVAGVFEALDQQVRLRGLAAPVHALEKDKRSPFDGSSRRSVSLFRARHERCSPMASTGYFGW